METGARLQSLLLSPQSCLPFEIQMLMVFLGCWGYINTWALVVSWRKEWAWGSFRPQLGKHQRDVRAREPNWKAVDPGKRLALRILKTLMKLNKGQYEGIPTPLTPKDQEGVKQVGRNIYLPEVVEIERCQNRCYLPFCKFENDPLCVGICNIKC